MVNYWIKSIIPHNLVENFYNALEEHALCINAFEDESSPPSSDLDDNGFHIASSFNFDILCESTNVDVCLNHLKTAAAIFGLNLEIKVESVENNNWLLSCHQNQPVINIHPFLIHSADVIVENTGKIPLIINAATAFGSGEHPTTQGCLKLFLNVARKYNFTNICDMGCGSGILSIAANKIQPNSKVVAIDIEKEAVVRTILNTRINNCRKNFSVIHSVGFSNPLTHGLYDLCFANILAKPLMHMAYDMGKYIKKNGFIIASGLLKRQANMVISSYKNAGFNLYQHININGWVSLLLKKQ